MRARTAIPLAAVTAAALAAPSPASALSFAEPLRCVYIDGQVFVDDDNANGGCTIGSIGGGNFGLAVGYFGNATVDMTDGGTALAVGLFGSEATATSSL